MASILIRGLPEPVHRALKVRAAQNGTSLQAEARGILERAVAPAPAPKFDISELQAWGRRVFPGKNRLPSEELIRERRREARREERKWSR